MPQNISTPFLQKNSVNFCLVLLVVFFVFGCFWSSDRNSSTSTTGSKPIVQESNAETKNSNVPTSVAANKTSSDEKVDNGDFIVKYLEVKDQRYAALDKQLKDAKLLENAADQLNRNLKLPTNIYLTLNSCKEPNAEYNPNNNTITICYELMEYFQKIFKGTVKSEQEIAEKSQDAVRFVFLHELGHAMIDLYKLPIIGNEEDAADRASAYICLEEIEGGVKSVLAAADAFSIGAKVRANDKRDFSNEHLLHQQRFYNSLCMIYGSDTVKYADFKKNGYLPEERAARCPAEYEKTMQGWKELLKPWRK